MPELGLGIQLWNRHWFKRIISKQEPKMKKSNYCKLQKTICIYVRTKVVTYLGIITWNKVDPSKYLKSNILRYLRNALRRRRMKEDMSKWEFKKMSLDCRNTTGILRHFFISLYGLDWWLIKEQNKLYKFLLSFRQTVRFPFAPRGSGFITLFLTKYKVTWHYIKTRTLSNYVDALETSQIPYSYSKLKFWLWKNDTVARNLANEHLEDLIC